ncbi:TPA: tRNA (adenosine(37)-N6)-threonylcarbamoyltransferase complex dimerization subunit type 1 TsaB [bacterium]|nr:tRNA (adenosine(37)-N6)-threonylcarbamoyltransferase complex dimerization subunit type 1 TsaB [bacterium]
MKALGIETSTEVASISIVEDEKIIAQSLYSSHILKHGTWLANEIEHIFSQLEASLSDIDLVAVSSGPGSYTGLRIGIATGQGISKGLNIPIFYIPTLDGIVLNVIEEEKQICPLIDAKRGRIHLALYKKKRRITEYITCNLSDLFSLITQETIFLGNGSVLYGEEIRKNLGKIAYFADSLHNIPYSSNIALLGIERLKKRVKDEGPIFYS